MLVEFTIKQQGLEISRFVAFNEMMGVYNDIKALFPRVAWLNVLDVVLRIKHEDGLLVTRNIKVLIGQSNEYFNHVNLDQ